MRCSATVIRVWLPAMPRCVSCSDEDEPELFFQAEQLVGGAFFLPAASTACCRQRLLLQTMRPLPAAALLPISFDTSPACWCPCLAAGILPRTGGSDVSGPRGRFSYGRDAAACMGAVPCCLRAACAV